MRVSPSSPFFQVPAAAIRLTGVVLLLGVGFAVVPASAEAADAPVAAAAAASQATRRPAAAAGAKASKAAASAAGKGRVGGKPGNADREGAVKRDERGPTGTGTGTGLGVGPN